MGMIRVFRKKADLQGIAAHVRRDWSFEASFAKFLHDAATFESGEDPQCFMLTRTELALLMEAERALATSAQIPGSDP